MRPIAFVTISVLFSGLAVAQTAPAPTTPPNEAGLGEFVVTGTKAEHVTKLAVLPSWAPDLEHVIVRSAVRRDLELSGRFDIMPDARAPTGRYYFEDPVDIDAWKKIGAEVIVKVAARKTSDGKGEGFGLAFFP